MSTFGPFEPPPAVWGVGRVVVDGTVTPWPVSATDIDDEAASQAELLGLAGLREDGLILVVSMLSRAIHAVPVEQAAGLLGARYSSADATVADAFRVAYLVRQLAPTVVVGIDDEVRAGLHELGHDPGELLAAASTPGWVRLGPTSAWELAPGVLTYDATRWRVDLADDGELLLTNLVPRCTSSEQLRTGVRGYELAPVTAS